MAPKPKKTVPRIDPVGESEEPAAPELSPPPEPEPKPVQPQEIVGTTGWAGFPFVDPEWELEADIKTDTINIDFYPAPVDVVIVNGHRKPVSSPSGDRVEPIDLKTDETIRAAVARRVLRRSVMHSETFDGWLIPVDSNTPSMGA